MATINVQAGAAAHVIDRQPDAAKGALDAIRRASGDVLDELAAMLALLREDDETAERGPTPGIDQIAPLVEATRSTSLRVPLIIDGPTATVPRSVGTAAYRIVQESLTNVLRHAEAKIARVTVRAGDDRSLVIEVCDDGTGAQLVTAGTGVGIRGMRERATSTGGQLEAGMAPGGGFVVRARWDGRT
jgi:signal transduction histidine kinase